MRFVPEPFQFPALTIDSDYRSVVDQPRVPRSIPPPLQVQPTGAGMFSTFPISSPPGLSPDALRGRFDVELSKLFLGSARGWSLGEVSIEGLTYTVVPRFFRRP